MKLLHCLGCNDIVSLAVADTRPCRCGKSAGRYITGNCVEYRGPAIILGIMNTDLVLARDNPRARGEWVVIPSGRAGGNRVRLMEDGNA